MTDGGGIPHSATMALTGADNFERSKHASYALVGSAIDQLDVILSYAKVGDALSHIPNSCCFRSLGGGIFQVTRGDKSVFEGTIDELVEWSHQPYGTEKKKNGNTTKDD